MHEQKQELLRERPDLVVKIQEKMAERLRRSSEIRAKPLVELSAARDQIKNVLAKIQPGLKYLLILDLDNTVWPQHDNLIVSHLQTYHNFSFPYLTFDQLLDIGKAQQEGFDIKPLILTARTSTELQSSIDPFNDASLPKLDKYCNMGVVHCRDLRGTRFPEGLTYASEVRPEMVEAWNQEAIRVCREHVRLDPLRMLMHYTGDPTAFYISYTDQAIHFKEQMTKFICSQESEYFKWKPIDSSDGYLTIFVNEKLPFNKAQGLEFLLQHQKANLKDPKLRLIIVGNSSTDELAMRHALEILPPEQVMNIRVGGAIKPDCVDFSFRSIEDTQSFVAGLHRKVTGTVS